MEYFFWTAMPWVCLDITMPFSTMHYYMSLVLPSQSMLLFAALSSLYIIHFSPPLLDSVNELTIIRRGWAKYRDLSVVSRDQLFASAERQIIDPLTTDKSWSFAVTVSSIIILSTRVSKISWFVGGESRSVICLSRKANNWSAHHWQIMIFCGNRQFNNNIVLSFGHRVCFSMNIFGKLPFSRKTGRKKEKSVVWFTYEQNVICSQTQSQTPLGDIAHEQTIICRQLFAGHVVGFRSMTLRILDVTRFLCFTPFV